VKPDRRASSNSSRTKRFEFLRNVIQTARDQKISKDEQHQEWIRGGFVMAILAFLTPEYSTIHMWLMSPLPQYVDYLMTFLQLLMSIGGIYVLLVLLSIPMKGIPSTFSKVFYLLATRWLSSGVMSGIMFFPIILVLCVISAFGTFTVSVVVSFPFDPQYVLIVSLFVTIAVSLASFGTRRRTEVYK
jgi:cellulose synthase/poly-beta-1,6-N-acetylglucosamine synthase-like glycosyltransferase